MSYCVVYVTVPTGPNGLKIANEIVRLELAACVNIIPKIQSVYKWKNKIVKDKENLLIIKTRKILLKKLNKKISQIHPYDIPEVIALPIIYGNKPYLQWISKET